MQRRAFSSLLFLSLTGGGLPPVCWALTPDEVMVDAHDGSYSARLSMRVAVTVNQALAVLTDFEQMPAFMPGLQSSRIIGQEGRNFHVLQRDRVEFSLLSVDYESERQIEVIDGRRILSRSLGNSGSQTRSEMRLTPQGNFTRLDYQIEITPDRWLPTALARNFFQHELAEQFSALEKEMLRRSLGGR